ncbi:MAG: hypothetical protein ACLU8F_00860 [Clostridia bacterium]
MGKVIICLIGSIVALIGVIMIYDARILTKKLFGFGDQNDASLGLKLFGFVLTMIGAGLLFFYIV